MRGNDGIGCSLSVCGPRSSGMRDSHCVDLIAAWESAGRNRWRFRREGSWLCCCTLQGTGVSQNWLSKWCLPLRQEGDATEAKSEVRNTACTSSILHQIAF